MPSSTIDNTSTIQVVTLSDGWDPDQYHRFQQQRRQPFDDLLDLLEPTPMARAVDLGCGSGELTADLAARFGIAHTVGIDHSATMLAAAAAHARPGIVFDAGDLATFTSPGDLDLVLANASLQWVPDHPAVLARWAGSLRPGGQLAVQVPANADQPSHVAALRAALRPEFADAFGPDGPPPDPVAGNVLAPQAYATLLYELGFERQHVRLQVYPHVLPSSRDVVEWVKGTTLTRFSAVLPAGVFARFVDAYTEELLTMIGDRSPLFFPFKRILMSARLPD
jgi:trans-aconitate 2-methyltransferase